MKDLEHIAGAALRAVLKAGAEEADLRVVASRELTLQLRMGELEVLKEAGGRRLQLRVYRGRRKALLSVSDPSPEAMERLAAEAVALAAICEPADQHRLPDAELYAEELPELDLHDPAVRPGTDSLVARIREMESVALGCDPRIDNNQAAGFRCEESRWCQLASNGFRANGRGSSYGQWVIPIARESSGERVTEGWGRHTRHFSDLPSPAALGQEAARRVLRRLDARQAPTGRFPVIFEPLMAARILGGLFRCLSGAAVWRRQSYLADRLGDEVAAPLISLRDDPHRLRGLGSRPCDGEGLPGRAMALVDGGVLASFATDLESARRLELPLTGHGVWGGGVSSSNLYLVPGDLSPGDIVASTRRGLLVTGMMGSGFQPTSGHWSQGVMGHWIEDGALAYPVREATIAASLDEVLGRVDALGDDLDFELGAVVSPTLRVAEMTVAGA